MNSVTNQNKTTCLFRVRINFEGKLHVAYVTSEKFSIGSAPNSPVIIHDKSVEKTHLVITQVDNQIWISDQGTTYGTQVNGKRIEKNVATLYSPGDTLLLGNAAYLLQIHLFTLSQNQKIDSEGFLKETRERATKEAEEIIGAAKKRGEEHAAKVSALHLKRLMEEGTKQVEAAREKFISENQSWQQDYQNKAILTAQQEAEAILKKAQAEALALKQESLAISQQSLDESKKTGMQANLLSHEQATLHMQRLIEQSAELRKRAEGDVTEMLKNMNEQMVEKHREAKRAADALIESSRAQAQELLDKARHEGEQRMEESWRSSLQVKQEAQKEASVLFETVLNQAEAKALEHYKSREQRAQRICDEAFERAEKIVQAAHLEVEKISRTQSAQALEERRAQMAKTLSDAAAAGEEIKVAARRDAEKTTETARFDAEEIVARAQDQANEMMRQSKQLLQETQAGAHEESQRLLTQTQEKCTALLRAQERENQRLLEEARASAAAVTVESQSEVKELRRQSEAAEAKWRENAERDLRLRHEQVESELQGLRKAEMERMGLQWTQRLQMMQDKKQQEVQLLLKNIELSLPMVLQNSLGKSISDDNRTLLFQSLSEIIKLAFPNSSQGGGDERAILERTTFNNGEVIKIVS